MVEVKVIKDCIIASSISYNIFYFDIIVSSFSDLDDNPPGVVETNDIKTENEIGKVRDMAVVKISMVF